MSWFGWMTKPGLEVTLPDALIGVFEFFAVMIVINAMGVFFESRGKRATVKKKESP